MGQKSHTIAGIFVGGRSLRMGGRPKGLLLAPPSDDARSLPDAREPIVLRWQKRFAALGIDVVLVGERREYGSFGIPGIDDEPAGVGPLGGLIALLAFAEGGNAIAVACDMPYVSLGLLAKLAFDSSCARAVAARRDAQWEPLFARYDARACLDVAREHLRAGRRSLYGVLDAVSAEALTLSDEEMSELRDWDTPADIEAAAESIR